MSKIFKFKKDVGIQNDNLITSTTKDVDLGDSKIGDSLENAIEFAGDVSGDALKSFTKGDLMKAVPSEYGPHINIKSDFPWTKSDPLSDAVRNTPSIHLTEFYVTSPAFFMNLKRFTEQAADFGQSVSDTIKTAFGFNLQSEVGTVLNAVAGMFGTNEQQTPPTAKLEDFRQTEPNADHLQSYANLYGVKKSNFIYSVPFTGSSYKNVNTSWGSTEGFLEMFGDLFKGVSRLAAPAIGVDLAKQFDYDTSGMPSTNVTFHLDNTNGNDFEKNFNFVYLLLYQNLPGRVNKNVLLPPCIYRAFLPGVFSYIWCTLDSIQIDMVGVRRSILINVGGIQSSVLIPEAYKINFQISSLLPESKNLYYDSIKRTNTVSVMEEGFNL